LLVNNGYEDCVTLPFQRVDVEDNTISAEINDETRYNRRLSRDKENIGKRMGEVWEGVRFPKEEEEEVY
jgi:hypothetical protein